jgi:hypothetical protein
MKHTVTITITDLDDDQIAFSVRNSEPVDEKTEPTPALLLAATLLEAVHTSFPERTGFSQPQETETTDPTPSECCSVECDGDQKEGQCATT